jgi:hypothetical protein
MREMDGAEAGVAAFVRELDARDERAALSGMRPGAPALVYSLRIPGSAPSRWA